MSYFFDGLADPTAAGDSDGASEQFVNDFLMTGEGLELAATFPKIQRPRVRRRILELVRTLAGDDDAS